MALIVNGTTIPIGKPFTVNGHNVEKVVANGVTVWDMEIFDMFKFVFNGEALNPLDQAKYYVFQHSKFTSISSKYNGVSLDTAGAIYLHTTGVDYADMKPIYVLVPEAGQYRVYASGLTVTDGNNGHYRQIAKGQLIPGGIPAKPTVNFGAEHDDTSTPPASMHVVDNSLSAYYDGVAVYGLVITYDHNTAETYIFSDDGYIYKRGAIHGDKFGVAKSTTKWK